jgi:hypothetical protein
MKKKLLMTLVLSTCWCVATRAQMIAANIDALWALMMSPSVGLEVVVGERSTVGLNGLLVHKPYGQNIKMAQLQPEYRYYFSGRPMFREFIGIGAIGGTHNIEWKGKIYDGMNVGLGMTFGYVMPIGKRFNVDFHAGFGAVYYNHKEYFTGDQYDADSSVDGLEKNNASGYYLLPTRIGVSITYILK